MRVDGEGSGGAVVGQYVMWVDSGPKAEPQRS